MRIVLMALFLLGVAGCTWVKLSEEGATVAVASSGEIESCKRVGKITAISRAKVAGVERNDKKLNTELETIARNEAVSMGGNTVSPLGPVDGNEREFGVYTCETR